MRTARRTCLVRPVVHAASRTFPVIELDDRTE
jgi:hypothetical protein